MPKYLVTVKLDARYETVVQADTREEAEDSVWVEIGEYCENIDIEDIEFGDVSVRARVAYP